MLTFDWAADVEVEQLEEVVELADEWLSELLLILFLNLSNSEIFLSEMKEDINKCANQYQSIFKLDSNPRHFVPRLWDGDNYATS